MTQNKDSKPGSSHSASEHGDHGKGGGHHHYTMTPQIATPIWLALMVLTVITVAIAKVDLGVLNLPIALFVATIKAMLVILFFMGIVAEDQDNRVIFGTSFIFLAIFMTLTSFDLFFRGNVTVTKADREALIELQAASGPQFTKPWVKSDEVMNAGKKIFDQQCVACHGAMGKGDGPAAAALNPKPRNFTSGDGWSNGRKPSQVVGTLTNGLRVMPSFASMPAEQRWAVAHYILSLGPTPPADSEEDLKTAGVDSSKDKLGGEESSASIPVSAAMKLLATDAEAKSSGAALLTSHGAARLHPDDGRDMSAKALYASNCLTCHGENGQGGIRVQNISMTPYDPAYINTKPLNDVAFETFERTVTRGVPGTSMPANAQLSSAQLKDLFQYVKSLR